MSNAGHVSGKVAVVTGGAHGMGAAHVRAWRAKVRSSLRPTQSTTSEPPWPSSCSRREETSLTTSTMSPAAPGGKPWWRASSTKSPNGTPTQGPRNGEWLAVRNAAGRSTAHRSADGSCHGRARAAAWGGHSRGSEIAGRGSEELAADVRTSPGADRRPHSPDAVSRVEQRPCWGRTALVSGAACGTLLGKCAARTIAKGGTCETRRPARG